MRNKMYGNRGFTLVELAVVMLMSGTIIMLGARFVKLYSIGQQHEITVEHANIAFSVIREFQATRGVYPCPADPDLGPNDANYGVAQCASYDNCATDPAGEIKCTTVGSRDTDGIGGNDAVLIGVVPFRTLSEAGTGTPYNMSHRADGYGALIAYAVTEHMTNTALFDFENPINSNTGVIRIEDENNFSLTTPDSSAHFNVFSFGDNSLGGYSIDGQIIEACLVPSLTIGAPPEAPPPGPSAGGLDVEIENCDNNDAIFSKATRSVGDNAEYFDDISLFNVESFAPLWKRSPGVVSPDSFLYNTNLGDVGIGTDTPTKQLHIVGDLKSNSNIMSERYCEDADNMTECMFAEAIGGDIAPMECAVAGEAAYAIGNNSFECRAVQWQIPNKSCPAHDFDNDNNLATINFEMTLMSGFSNLGNLVCCRVNQTLGEKNCCKYDGTSCTSTSSIN